LGLDSHRPSEHFANSQFSDPNQINDFKLNTSGPKWTASENTRSLEGKNDRRCNIAPDRFAEKSPDFIGI